MDIIFDRVAITKNVSVHKVKSAWNFMMQRMVYALSCSNLVFVPGFGLFFTQDKHAFFSRIIHHTKKIKKSSDKQKMFKINNVILPTLNHIVYNSFMMPIIPPVLVNTIRLKHDANDPLDLAVFIEINREVIVRRRDLFVDELGWILVNANWCQFMHCIDLNKNQNTTKINAWIPRLVSILKELE
jgi:hypothetical protein